MQKVDIEVQTVVVSLALLAHKDAPRNAVADAVQNLWELSVRQRALESKGWIEEMQGPIYDPSVIIGIQYESVKEFLEHYEADKIIFREAFKIELEDSTVRYFKQKLLSFIHEDLEDHMITSKSPVAQDELVRTEKRLDEVELAWF